MGSQLPPVLERSAKPFVKWVGGKHQLLSQFEVFFPRDFTRYFEPFVGSGAVFFHLWNQQRLPGQVYLFDTNAELINAYEAVQHHLEELVAALETHQTYHSKEYYEKIRTLDRQAVKLGKVEMAARTIYLNKTCYNGLYRVNQKGQFNVPMGRYKKPGILNRKALQSTHEALQKVCLGVKDFRELPHLAQPGDFFYFDPPYAPVSATANFTSYTASNFRERDQRDLADVFTQLTQKGCLCMLSNSNTLIIRELYRGYRMVVVQAKRVINANANRRGPIQEILVMNWN